MRRGSRLLYSGQIYLLKKIQMNGMHAELFSYALHHKLQADMARFTPLQLDNYCSVSDTETVPSFYMSFTKNEVLLWFAIWFADECFNVR